MLFLPEDAEEENNDFPLPEESLKFEKVALVTCFQKTQFVLLVSEPFLLASDDFKKSLAVFAAFLLLAKLNMGLLAGEDRKPFLFRVVLSLKERGVA